MPKFKCSLSFSKKLPALVLSTILVIFSMTASSQRAFTLRSPAFNIRGDATIIGNRVVGGANAAKDNNATTISNIDLDGDATTTINSSSANLVLPVGYTIQWAGLYWAGRSTDVANRDKIKFKKASDTYSTYTATQLDNGNTITGITAENHYQGFIDVTAYVQSKGSGTYWAGDILTITGNGSLDPYSTGYYAGWGLIVIYGDDMQPYRNITVFDGYTSVWAGNGTGNITIPISGFLTPASGSFTTKIGTVAWEGDLFISNDKLRLNVNDDAHNVSDANNPATNFFNGSITNSPRNPNTVQNWGVDFDYITSNISLPANSTSTNVYFNTSGDFYLPGALIFTVDINPVLLPVELLSFDAIRKDNSVQLEWATASETNNDYFEIERSTNSYNWAAIGRMAGQGQSIAYRFYEWEDETAFAFINNENPEYPTIYYRLKQVDYNGKFSYGGVKSVRFEIPEVFNFSIYPNPSKANTKIYFTNPCDPDIDIKISDINGKTVFITHFSPGNFNSVDLYNFKSGTYFIEAKTEMNLVRKRLVVE